ncbi:MAG: hypothetical protein HY658_03230 [Actinobacteria bacterium]|nr:hypothetical protein [Actinomycetota bacterium]
MSEPLVAITVNGPVFLKGVLVVVMAFVLFVGSVYLLLAAVFGVRMGYLVMAVALFGWMLLLSAMWTFGAPGTLKNIGPRPTGPGAGAEPHWQPIGFGVEVASPQFPVVDEYPGEPWREPVGGMLKSVEPATTAIQEFLAERANEELGIEVARHIPEIAGGGPPQEFAEGQEPIQPTQFVVQDLRFATSGKTSLVAARAFFEDGGPVVTVFAHHDPGNVPAFSWAFLIASIIGLAVHLPFLDRAERKRRDVLTGGTAPEWLGPA